MFVLALLGGPFSFTERWSTPAPIGSISSNDPSFRVVGDRIYYFENEYKKPQIFGCLSATNGRRLWKTTGPVSTASYLNVTSKYVMASTENDILQLDPNSGKIVWRARRESYRAGPVVAGDRMYYEPTRGTLIALDLRTHRPIWQRKFPFGLANGFPTTTADSGNLLFANEAGDVVSIAAADGSIKWRTPVEKNRIFRFVSMGDTILVVGERYVALRKSDGKPLWRAETGTSGQALYLPKTKEIWSAAEDGRLYRFSAINGKALLPTTTLGPEAEHNFNEPLSYGGGVILPTQRSILKLGPQGQPVATFDTEDRLSEFHVAGEELIVRSHNRFVRLRPGLPKPVTKLEVLLAKPKLSPEERRSIVRLGKPALRAIIDQIPRTKDDDHLEALEEMMYVLADRSDTRAIIDLSNKLGGLDRDHYPDYIGEWLRTQGDPTLLADSALAKLKAAKNERETATYLSIVARGSSPAIVDELLQRMRNAATPDWQKAVIYASLAASGRAEALALIRELRATGRQLATPIAKFSATADRDGDGLADNVDANPFVAPRELSETEKVLFATFDARFRFDERTKAIGQMSYGEGVKPFEVVGWRGGLVPADKMAEAGLKEATVPARRYQFPFVRFEPLTEDGQMVQFSKNGTEATAAIGVTYGGLDGIGFRAKLRKIDGEWYVVSLDQTWIS